jgi:glutamine transport system permease protein
MEVLPQLLKGAGATLMIAAIGIGGGIALGFVVGLTRQYGPRPLRPVCVVFVEFIRGTPLVVQVMFIYFALPVALGIRFDPFTAGVVAIVVNAGAYIAELVRGAFASVDPGLREAGIAMGLPPGKILAFISAPIALRRLVPALGNQVIISLKDTSLLIVIGVAELTRTGQEIMAVNFRSLEVWTAVALIYLAITLSLSGLLRLIERKARIL